METIITYIKCIESGSRPKGGVGTDGEIPSLGAEHLNDEGGFDFSKLKKVSRDFYSKQKRGIINISDILLVKDGATTGKVSYVGEDFIYKEASINEHLFRIQTKKNLVLLFI